MSNTPSLLSCPFCGCRAVASINKGESLWSHDVVNWTRVHCTNDDCNAQTEATCEGYEPSAIEVWNRRTPQPVVREPLTDENVEAASRRAFPRWWNSYGFSLCGGDPHMQTPQRVYAMRGFMGGFESGYKVALTDLGITQKGGSNAE